MYFTPRVLSEQADDALSSEILVPCDCEQVYIYTYIYTYIFLVHVVIHTTIFPVFNTFQIWEIHKFELLNMCITKICRFVNIK